MMKSTLKNGTYVRTIYSNSLGQVRNISEFANKTVVTVFIFGSGKTNFYYEEMLKQITEDEAALLLLRT